MKTEDAVGVEDVLAAQHRLRLLPRTPVVYSEHFGAHLKLENLQVTGSFKVRGAYNALSARGDRRPVVAASAGNHAKGVAWSARALGLRATVVVPESAPRTKVEGCVALGAQVIRFGKTFEEAYAHAIGLEGQYLHAFNDPDVIAGQGTVALELLDLDPDVVLVPIGGGSLASGMALVLKTQGIRVVGVKVERMDSIADGLRVKALGRLTGRLCAELLDEVVTVTEEEVRRTVVELFTRERVVAEGAGAAAVAALSRVSGSRRAAVVSGGNIDGDLLFELCRATL